MTVTVKHPNTHHNNWGIEFRSDDPKVMARFNRICYRELTATTHPSVDPRYNEKKSWGAFHQGDASGWSYWEFWMPQTEENKAKVFAKAEEITREMQTPDPVQWEWDESL